MKKYLLLAAVAFAGAASPAFAQETAPANFTGPRIEARAGWDHSDFGTTVADEDFVEVAGGDEDGVSYGVELGYDAQVGNGIILGAYAGVDFTTADHCENLGGGDEGCFEIGRNFTVGVRAGMSIGSNAAIFARGGYSNGRVAFQFNEGQADNFELGQDLDGFHVGAGVEFNLGGNLYASGQYVYTNYGSIDYSDDDDFGFALETDRHQLLVGIGLRF